MCPLRRLDCYTHHKETLATTVRGKADADRTGHRAPGGEPPAGVQPVLSVRGLTKRFPGVLANDSISFDVFPGDVHALLGENGAGKSTLVKCLYGYYQRDAGEI